MPAINQLFDAASPAMMGSRNAATTSLLTWGYIGGRIGSLSRANGTVALTASATNYIVMKKSDLVVSVSTLTTNWNDSADYWRLYSVVTNTTTVTSYEDERLGTAGLFGIGALPGLVNPMTTAEDFIKGGASGAPVRVPVGSPGQVIGVDPGGALEFINNPAGFANPMTTAGDLIVGGAAGAADRLAKGTAYQVLRMDSTATAAQWASLLQTIPIACGDELTPMTAGAAKVTFHMPFAFVLTEVIAGLTTPQTSGSIFTVDVNEAGASVLSTKLTIDNTEETSLTAATPPVVSDTALAKGAKITIDVDQVGDGTAAGLKVYLVGYVAQ